MTREAWVREDIALIPHAPSDRSAIVKSLGGSEYTPDGVVDLHDSFTGSNRPLRKFSRSTEFVAAGEHFFWLTAASGLSVLDAEIDLECHGAVQPDPEVMNLVVSGIEHLSTNELAFHTFRTFVSHLCLLEPTDPGVKPITSCSIPDFPFVMFFTRIASRHIPPLTLVDVESPVLLAENMYHESVHQFVNNMLLTRNILKPSYDSATSPRVEIYWRRNAQGVSSSWELDRCLHAATVYAQVVRWRVRELRSRRISSAERQALEEANLQSTEALSYLCLALQAHLEAFTPAGCVFLGRLVEAATERIYDARAII